MGRYPVGAGPGAAGPGDEQRVGLVQPVDDVGVEGVERPLQDVRVIGGDGGPMHTGGMRHAVSEQPADAGHPTDTHAAGDREPAPTARGRTARPGPDCPVEVALAAAERPEAEAPGAEP
ncbi:hypothetical protein [Streptomyces sp. NPDC017448]|uniref:hypothetical protein n=1 Tax=Streptomyces sp. NPDC017448 TaxID=3364996 RepID=UPI0037BA958E